MDLEADILVVGGGLAGIVAGTVAAENGLSTIVARKGLGATEYSSGAIDILGYLPGSFIPFSSSLEGLQFLPELYPLHPYAVLAANKEDTEEASAHVAKLVESCIDWLKAHLDGTSVPLVGSADTNLSPITVFGTTKPTCLVQETMSYGSLFEDADNVLLFAGFTGHPEFNPSVAAKTFLERQMKRNEPPKKVGHCVIDVLPYGKPYNLTSIDIARHLDHNGSLNQITQLLKPKIEQIGATHLALPPVMGLEKAKENIKQIESELGVECFELLSMPPSIPGIRLQRALDRMLVASGGRLLIGYEATGAKADENRIHSVTLQSFQRQIEVSTRSVVLATGKFIGGGITGDERGFREPVFNLTPVTEEFYSAAAALPLRHTNRLAITMGGHPFLATGLSIDFTLRPIDKDGDPALENLFCAGSIIAGYNYSAEKSGLGVSLVTGHTAGLYAGAYSKGRR